MVEDSITHLRDIPTGELIHSLEEVVQTEAPFSNLHEDFVKALVARGDEGVAPLLSFYGIRDPVNPHNLNDYINRSSGESGMSQVEISWGYIHEAAVKFAGYVMLRVAQSNSKYAQQATQGVIQQLGNEKSTVRQNIENELDADFSKAKGALTNGRPMSRRYETSQFWTLMASVRRDELIELLGYDQKGRGENSLYANLHRLAFEMNRISSQLEECVSADFYNSNATTWEKKKPVFEQYKRVAQVIYDALVVAGAVTHSGVRYQTRIGNIPDGPAAVQPLPPQQFTGFAAQG